MKDTRKNPYSIIKSRRATEKTTVLEGLKDAQSNKSVSRCESPKYVFLVDMAANKMEIATALQEIYKDQNVKVVKVNTIIGKPKVKRRRGKTGRTAAYKKAVVTFEKGDNLDNI